MIRYCTLCRRNVQPARHYGVGTLILCLLTVGWWLLAMPFYPKCCPICGGRAMAAGPYTGPRAYPSQRQGPPPPSYGDDAAADALERMGR